jgi:hypothetical protein
MLRPVLVGRADDLDGGHESAGAPFLVDADLVLVKGRHVDLDRRAQMDARLGEVALGQLPAQAGDNHGRPTAIKTFPPSSINQRCVKVIASRHVGTPLTPR